MEVLPQNITIRNIYYVKGRAPKHWEYKHAISDPPNAGWGYAIVIAGDRRSTIFSPYTFGAYQVPNSCAELTYSKTKKCAPEKIVEIVTRGWHKCVRLDLAGDFEIAAVILNALHAEVPKVIVIANEQTMTKGKPMDINRLDPLDKSTKKGQIADFFSKEPQSIFEAMAKFELTRSGILSHLFCINRDNGFGYSLGNDRAQLLYPKDYQLFKSETEARESTHKVTGKDPSKIFRPIKVPSRRADIAQAFENFTNIDEVASKMELTRAAILSHLFSMHAANGIGYEVSPDSKLARIIVPEGISNIFEPLTVSEVKAEITPEVIKLVRSNKEPTGQGKPVEANRFVPVKKSSKRGQIVQAFLTEQGSSVADIAQLLDITKAAVLSHLYTMWQNHGLGYVFLGTGKVRILSPVANPFKE